MGADRKSIHLGHHDIQNDQIRTFSARAFKPFFAVGSFESLMPLPFKQKFNQFHHIFLIIDDQNARQSYLRPFES